MTSGRPAFERLWFSSKPDGNPLYLPTQREPLTHTLLFHSSVLLPLPLCLFAVEAVVEFNYEAQQDDELSLTVGDIIVNIRQDDGGWWEGELGGRRGLFPDNFVRVSDQKHLAALSLSSLTSLNK